MTSSGSNGHLRRTICLRLPAFSRWRASWFVRCTAHAWDEISAGHLLAALLRNASIIGFATLRGAFGTKRRGWRGLRQAAKQAYLPATTT